MPIVTPEMRTVLWSGSVGGVVSAIYTYMAGATYGLPWIVALPACIPLGAVAAVIMVFYVTPTDTTRTNQLIAYSLLCGILWKPGIDAGKALVSQQIDAAARKARTSQVQQQAPTTNPVAAGAKLHDAGSAVATLLRSTDRIDNPRIANDATKQAAAVVKIVADEAPQNPVAATAALKEIGTAAKETDNGAIVSMAQQQLLRIARTAPPTQQISARPLANTALRELASQPSRRIGDQKY